MRQAGRLLAAARIRRILRSPVKIECTPWEVAPSRSDASGILVQSEKSISRSDW